jgi:hypothetical protein
MGATSYAGTVYHFEHLHVGFCGLVLNFDAFLIILFLPQS